MSDLNDATKTFDGFRTNELVVFDKALDANKALFVKRIYTNLPGAVEFEGEMYPPSRLHYLESRLKFVDIIFDREISFSRRHGFEKKHDNRKKSSSEKSVEVFYRFNLCVDIFYNCYVFMT
jgi:hypothetical protein